MDKEFLKDLLKMAVRQFRNERGMAGEDVADDDDAHKEDLPSGDAEVSETDKLLIEAGYSEDDLADLSDEEKSGLLIKDDDEEGDKGDDIDKGTLKDIAGEEETDEARIAREAVELAAAGGGEKTAEQIAADAATLSVIPDEELAKFRPVVKPEEVPEVDTVPPELDQKLTALEEKYDAGDIDLKEFSRERDTINRQIWRAQDKLSTEAREAKEWEKTQAYFFRNRNEYLIMKGETYTPQEQIKRTAIYGALGKTVEAIMADPSKSHLTDMQILLEADRQVKEAFGITKPAAVATKKGAAPIINKPKAALPNIVTLSDVPAAGRNSVDGDPFSALDHLSGEAYEDALERLTDAQRKAYEDGASRPSRRRVA